MKSKYKIQMQLKEDKQQFLLSATGITPNDNPLARDTTINYRQNVFCPFCLYKDSLGRFKLNRRLGKCPECNNKMLMITLTRMLKWNPEEYARFVFEYPYALFWSKCSDNFETWKQRLYYLNMSYEFWETYKYLKESISYTELEEY